MIFLTASWYSTGWWWKSSAVFTSGDLDTFCSSTDGVAGECLQIGDPRRGKRGDRIAADARAREVMRYGPREAHQPRLCRRVRPLPEVAVETGSGHDVHDGARGAAGLRLLAHHRAGGSEQPIGAGEVGPQHRVPGRRISLEDEGIANDRGVVDHDVDAAEALLGETHRLLRGFGLRYIAADGRCALHARRDLLGDARLERFAGNRHAGIDDDDARAVAAQVFDDGETDAARAAGDDRNAVLQVHAQSWL